MSQFLGVVFSPYVGNWTGTPPNAQVPLWNSYSEPDIIQMLEVIATEFERISTYSMGYAGYYPPTTPWNQLDSNCLVAGAASQLNQQMGFLAIQVAQGIYQHENPTHQQVEIEAAFSAASAANTVYPNTVTSFVFTNEYLVDANNVFNFVTTPSNTTHAIPKPTSNDVFGCDGVFNPTGSDLYRIIDGDIKNQVSSALNRTILLNSDSSTWCDPSQYYLNSITNYYAKILHELSIDGKSYAFPYDDKCEQSSTIVDTSPTQIVLTLTAFN